jgi:enoyl-CoA hydratase
MSVRVERRGPVFTVILARPEVRNAVDRATAEALTAAFREFEADAEAAAAVLWGEGGTFCAGADLKAISTGGGNVVRESGDGPLGVTRMQLQKPVIAAVAGHAVAGGLELALWCDGGTVRLPRIVGQGRALDMILTGRPVAAEEALRMGLADRLVPDGGSRAAAEALAAEIASFPQLCLRSDRRSAYEQWDLGFADALRNEYRLGWATIESGETREGATRFTQGAGRHGRFD